MINTLLLFGSAFIAGGLNAIAGGGSFISFPTLIFTGMPPIVANATNNTALWIATVASITAYRDDLKVKRQVMIVLTVTSLIGGILGSVALLYTSPTVFKKLIPYLLLLATLVFTFGDAFKQWLQRKSEKTATEEIPLLNLVIAQMAIAIYGGFFGAGMGILMLATLTFLGIKNIHTMNAFKAFLGFCINGIATIPFIFAGLIVWDQALLMAVGASIGSYLSAYYARQLEPELIRKFVIGVAFTMTAYFFIHG
jgi:uncharacterized protein